MVGEQKNKKMVSVVFYVFFCLLGFIMIYPLLWLVASSFKSNDTMFKNTYSLLPESWGIIKNYNSGFASTTGYSFGHFFMNSAIVTVIGVVCTIFSFLLAAYAVSRVKFFGANFWFGCIIMTMMIPAQVMVVPQYIILKKLHLNDTLLAMILPWAFGGAFFVFLIVQYMRGIPKELDEAAMIDGCSKIGILFKILVPVVQPAIVSAAIFAFYWIWQDFFQPLIFVGSPKNYTIVLIHGADDYWLINCSNIKPYAFLLDLIARCWRDGTVDAVQQSIAYTVAYYGLLHRSDVAQCLTDYAQFTVPYGPNEDDRVGDQFYNHVPRMLISQFVKDRTSPADDLRWLFDVPTLAEQSTHCAEIFQKAAENYAVYLRQCEKTAAELAEERFL